MSPDHIVKLLIFAGLCWILPGCQAGTPIAAVELFSHANCQGVSKGIQQIQFADLARIRNVQLMSSPATRSTDQSDPQSQLEEILLFVVSNGNQPTPGYGLDLTATETTGNELTLRYRWRTPAADAVLAQVMTSPCTVLQLDAHPDLTAVNAWLDDTLLGRVELDQPN